MGRQIKVFDTTLRDGEQSPGCSMNLNEKIEVALQLEKLGVDVIEAGFAIASPGDLAAIQAIAQVVKDCSIASLARATEKDIDAAFEGVRLARRPRIHTFIATSPIHMQYKLKMTPEQVLERSAAMVSRAKTYCEDVEFSAEDASRSDWPFLVKVFETVIRCGATVINIPDTVGYSTPDEMYALVKHVVENVSGIDKVEVSVHCHNDLGMAVANSLAAVRAGAAQVECTLNGIGERAGNASLEEVVMALNTRAPYFDVSCGVKTNQIYRSSKLVQTITGVQVTPNKAIVGANAFAHEAGIHQHGVMLERTTYEIMTPESIGIPQNSMVLGKHSGRHAFEERLVALGYQLDKKALDAAFEQFKILADKKKIVLDGDIDAIVGNRVADSAEAYRLDRFVINSGNTITATAIIRLSSGEKEFESVAIGDGPVDASFKAINDIVGMDLVLKDYSLHSVTAGEDALGEAVVKLGYDGRSVVGRGLSTDIIESSIKAYLNGVNKMMAEMGV